MKLKVHKFETGSEDSIFYYIHRCITRTGKSNMTIKEIKYKYLKQSLQNFIYTKSVCSLYYIESTRSIYKVQCTKVYTVTINSLHIEFSTRNYTCKIVLVTIYTSIMPRLRKVPSSRSTPVTKFSSSQTPFISFKAKHSTGMGVQLGRRHL